MNYIQPDFSKPGPPLIGLEIEMFGFDAQSLAPLGTPESRLSPQQLMQRIASAQGELKIDEPTGEIIGLDLGCGNFSLEPGGQLEYATCPGLSLATQLEELRKGLSILEDVSEKQVLFLDHGTNPVAGPDLKLLVPKYRYRILDRYFASQLGGRGVHMMRYSATSQPNIDIIGGQDAWQDAVNLALALTPWARLIFSNSYFFQGQPVQSSERQRIWQSIDPSRTGIPPVMNQPDIAAAYASWARQAHVFLAGNLPLEKQPLYGELTFEQWEISGWHGTFPDNHDWETHLGTLFPDLRLRHFLEVRMVDAQPFSHALAPLAFWSVALREGRQACWHWLKLQSTAAIELITVLAQTAHDPLCQEILLAYVEYQKNFTPFQGSAKDFVRNEGTTKPSHQVNSY